MVEEGLPFKEYLSRVRALIQSADGISGGRIPDDTIQLAVMASVRDQYAIL